MEGLEQVRRELAAVHRVCARLGLHEGIDNHISLRAPGSDGEMLLSPFPLHWAEVTASDVMHVGLADGRIVSGEHEVEATAWCIHGALQRAGGRHRCYVHTHMPWATSIACRKNGRLMPLHQHLIGMYHEIAYYDDYRGEVLEADEGCALVRALGDRSILFLANHGILAAGANAAVAFELLYFLERACQFQVLAEAGGHELRLLDESLLKAPTRKADPDAWGHAEKHLAAWMRILDREEPDYAR